MKYKIKSYKDGYGVFCKKHWYNSWYKYDNSYWADYNDALSYLNKYIIKMNDNYNKANV